MTSDDPKYDRTERTLQLVEDVWRRRSAGEQISIEAVIEAHPDLLPELEQRLRELRMNTAAGQAAQRPEDQPACPGNEETIDHREAGAEPATRQDTVRYFGDYEILDEIARGGMGVVYKARQKSLNRVVALKMIRAGELAGEAQVQRFHVEAEAAANLDHPNIVPLYEVGEHQGQHYFSLAYVDGQSLAEVLQDSLPNPRAAAQHVWAASNAIHYAHQQGVLHRDIKPGNVLIDTTGQIRITDFGLAKRIGSDSELTHDSQVLGTPEYMPPEQARGDHQQLGPTADVYSLGALLYALLTGRPPFRADNLMATLLQVADKEPVAPTQLNPDIDRDLETICLKCLEKDPHRRYGSAEALAEDLECWLGGEPITARPVSATERIIKWVRRKPVLAGFWATAALLLLTLTVGGPVVAVQQAKLRSEAETARNEAVEANTRMTQALADARQAKLETEEALRESERSRKLTELVAERFIGTFRQDQTQIVDTDQRVGELLAQLENNRRVLGQEHPETLTAMNDLAALYRSLRRHSEAEPLGEQALETRRRVLGEEHPDTLTSMNNLARLYQDQGRHAEAELLLQQTLETNHRVRGDEHPETLISMSNLGLQYESRRRYAEAEPLLKQALESSRRVLGEEHPDTLKTSESLAVVYRSLGRFAELEPLYKQALKTRRRVLGEEHPDTLTSMNNLASLYEAINRSVDAEPLRVRAVEHLRKKLPDSPQLASTLAQLGLNQLKQKKFSEAEPICRECLAIREMKMPDHWLLFSAKSLLGQALAGQEKYSEAEPLLLEGYEGLSSQDRKMKIPAEGRTRVTEALACIIQFYECWDKPEKVAQWRAKLPPPKKAQPNRSSSSSVSSTTPAAA